MYSYTVCVCACVLIHKDTFTREKGGHCFSLPLLSKQFVNANYKKKPRLIRTLVSQCGKQLWRSRTVLNIHVRSQHRPRPHQSTFSLHTGRGEGELSLAALCAIRTHLAFRLPFQLNSLCHTKKKNSNATLLPGPTQRCFNREQNETYEKKVSSTTAKKIINNSDSTTTNPSQPRLTGRSSCV